VDAAFRRAAKSRSPHRERGLKRLEDAISRADNGRSPHRERGLKHHVFAWHAAGAEVAPLTGSVD